MPHDQAARKAAMEPLNAFIGEWSMEASFPSGAPASPGGGAVVGRAVFEPVLDGQFLAQYSQIPHPDAPDSWAIVGFDPDSRAYTQHYFDSRGVARVYAMSFSDGVWTLLRDTPDFTPLSFSQRFTGAFKGETIDGRWESRTDGRWQRDFDLTYTRVA